MVLSCFLSIALVSPDFGMAGEKVRISIRERKFDTREEAVAEGERMLSEGHWMNLAIVIFSVRAMDGLPFRGKTKLYDARGLGHIPGQVGPGEFVLKVVQVRETTYPAALHLIVPGFTRLEKRVILRAGDLVIWDDIVLEPISPKNAGSIAGRVWLEDEEESVDGIVISVDGEALAFTNNQGYFVIDEVRSGTVTLLASKRGFAGLREKVKVKAGTQTAVVLSGYKLRFAHVRWLYQPDGTRSLKGVLPQGEEILGLSDRRRVSFAKGLANVQGRSDFSIKQVGHELVLWHFDVNTGDRPEAILLKSGTFDNVFEAPDGGYRRKQWTLREGDLFVIKCFDGKHYGMLYIISVTNEKPKISERP
jgi:hypothetical protein